MKKIRFTSAGKLLQGLKSQYILKNNSLIDKLRIVLLPRSDYTRNFCFSYLATVVFASSINSWLIVNWFFPFCSTIQQRKQIFQKLASSCLMPSLYATTFQLPTNISRRSFGWGKNETVVLEIWRKCKTYPDSPRRFQSQTLKAVPERPWIHFLYLVNIFVQ